MSAMSVGKKLFLGVGVSFAFTVALGCTGFLALSNVAARFQTVAGPTVEKYRLAYQIDGDVRELRSYERGVLVRASAHDQQTAERYMREYAATLDSIDASAAKLLSMVHRPDAIEDIKQIRALTVKVKEVDASMFEAVRANDLERATSIDVAQSLPAVAATIKVSDDLMKIQDAVLESDKQSANSAISFDRWTMALMMVPCFLVGGILVLVVFGVTRVLGESVSELGAAVLEVTAAAEQVALSSQSLAQGASEQAATIEETSSASAEINSMAQRTMENSRLTKDLVGQSEVRFEETDRSLTEMVDAMGGIISSSEKISRIIKVIEEIAFQTNILALNAAVEAARAGDAGMGFAVVADEVRSLSHRSAKAAKDTADLIEESIERSHGGKEKVDRVAESIRAVTAESAKVRVLIDEINLGSVEQSRGVDQISRSIHEMEKVTQGAAAGAEESAATAEELRTQARSLAEITRRMQALVGGGSTVVREQSRAPQRVGRPALAH